MSASRAPSICAAVATSLISGGIATAQPPPPPPPPPPAGGGGYYVEPQTGPRRGGFTGGLDIGLGMTGASASEGGGGRYGGLSGLNFQLGGFVNPRLAINLRVSGTSFVVTDADEPFTLFNGMLGLTAQFWAQPRLFVGGGIGIGVLSNGEESSQNETGTALTGRVGYEIVQWSASALHLALEITPTFYDAGLRVTSVGLQVGWQHY